ncbi:unnamed protein product [Citrullus colocynthis]|uniref:Dienelactone hydrolase domain-containing protein n=1 Tax=Citrullus colocynthis TaxID=252529 RepID=A0ABP0YFY3_9ROSI
MSGPQCCSNPPTTNPSSRAGHLEQLAGLNSYVTGSPDSKIAVILITDVFGYEASLLRKLADEVAAAGFFVVVPDFFKGDPYVPDDANRPIRVWFQDHEPVIYCLSFHYCNIFFINYCPSSGQNWELN